MGEIIGFIVCLLIGICELLPSRLRLKLGIAHYILLIFLMIIGAGFGMYQVMVNDSYYLIIMIRVTMVAQFYYILSKKVLITIRNI